MGKNKKLSFHNYTFRYKPVSEYVQLLMTIECNSEPNNAV
jgi:hypothetical protein